MPEDGSERRGTMPADVSLEDALRRRARLDRDRAAATIMEPGISEFHGPGAAAAVADVGANAAGVAVNALEGGVDAKKQALVMFADKYLWKTVVSGEPMTMFLSFIGLDAAAVVSRMEGWAVWKKVMLIFLNMLVSLILTGLIALMLMQLCILLPECRSQVLPWYLDMGIGLQLWWINL